MIADLRREVGVLLHSLREPEHVSEFAQECAKRARVYADLSGSGLAKDSAGLAEDYAAGQLAGYAAIYAAYTAYYADGGSGAYSKESELQIEHLKELHALEEKT